MEYSHTRHLSTLHDLHAAMAFAAMANGVDDDAEAALWQSRADDLLLSMRDYIIRSGGRLPRRQNDTTAPESSQDDATVPAPDEAVPLHSFPVGRGAAGIAMGASTGSVEDVGSGDGAALPPPDNLWVAEHVGLSLCEAMISYRQVSSRITEVHGI